MVKVDLSGWAWSSFGPDADDTPEPVRPSPARPSLPQIDVGGARVDLCSAQTLLTLVGDRLCAEDQAPLYVAWATLDHLYHFGRRGRHRGLISGADWLVLLDSMPVVATARRLTGRRWEQLAGSDLLPELLDVAVEAGARIAFLGGRPEMHERLRATLGEGWPALQIAGWWAPLRAELSDAEQAEGLAEQIRRSRADLLVVCLSKPLQELFLARYGWLTGVRVALAFGAAADFLADEVRQAPGLLRRLRLEWSSRLALEPRRLARRYLLQRPRALLDMRIRSRVVPRDPTLGHR